MPKYVVRDAMTRQKYVVQWQGVFQDCVFTIDKHTIGTFETKEALEQGKAFVLPDGATVSVQLKKKGPFGVILFTINKQRELYGFGRVARLLNELITISPV